MNPIATSLWCRDLLEKKLLTEVDVPSLVSDEQAAKKKKQKTKLFEFRVFF